MTTANCHNVRAYPEYNTALSSCQENGQSFQMKKSIINKTNKIKGNIRSIGLLIFIFVEQSPRDLNNRCDDICQALEIG